MRHTPLIRHSRPPFHFGQVLRLLLTLLLLAVGSSAHAADNAAAAFANGQQLFHAGSFADALPHFQSALAASGSPNASLYVARCHREQGEVAAAYEAMSQTLKLASDQGRSTERYRDTQEAATAELAELNSLVGRVVVILKDDYADPSIEINGETLDNDALNEPHIVNPGSSVIVVSASGMKDKRREAEVEAGDTETIVVGLSSVGGEAEEAEGLTTVQKAGIGVAGAGAVGIVVFAITGSMAQSKFDEVSTACGGVRCNDTSQNEAIDDGRSLETIANVSLALGAVAGLAGGAMILFGGAQDDVEPDDGHLQFHVAPTFGGAQAGIMLSF